MTLRTQCTGKQFILKLKMATLALEAVIGKMLTLGITYCTSFSYFYKDRPSTPTKPYAIVKLSSAKDNLDGSTITAIFKIEIYTDETTLVSGYSNSDLRGYLMDQVQKQFDTHEADLGVTSLQFTASNIKRTGNCWENTMFCKLIMGQI